AFHLKDLQSKNGTHLNDQRIESEVLHPGDQFRVGGTVFRVKEKPSKGPDTMLHEVEEQMADGKGYRTILREIVNTVDPPKKRRPTP
ncbi:MAG: FHA domain-containing protein, partial [Akkermansiaceae bacterium]|nr:FHA domain-containing protein [Akkermansiaceae bacterium]